MVTRRILIFLITLLIFLCGFREIYWEITYTFNIYQIDPEMITSNVLVKCILVNFEIDRIWSLEQY